MQLMNLIMKQTDFDLSNEINVLVLERYSTFLSQEKILRNNFLTLVKLRHIQTMLSLEFACLTIFDIIDITIPFYMCLGTL